MKNTAIKNFLFAFFLVPAWVSAQKIYSYAGVLGGGYSGDGGLATQARLQRPAALVLDAGGNMYIADQNNHCIRKISISGSISTIAGNGTPGYSGDGGPATAALLNLPTGIAVDGSGNIFFSDMLNSRIRKISPTGIITTIAGNGTFTSSGDGGLASQATLDKPFVITFDANGNIFLIDNAGSRVRKISTTGIISTVVGGGTLTTEGVPATSAQMVNANGLALDISGNIFVAESDKNRIRKINTSGIITTIAGTGVTGGSGNGGPAINAQFNFPAGMAIVNSQIYITEWGNHCLRKINGTGIIDLIAGDGNQGISPDGTTATLASINSPNAVAIAANGNIYIADWAANKIWMICDNSCVFAGIKSDQIDYKFYVYPNPASNIINVYVENPVHNTKLSLINSIGQIISEQEVITGTTGIDISKYPKGFYSIMISESNHKTSFRKIIIE